MWSCAGLPPQVRPVPRLFPPVLPARRHPVRHQIELVIGACMSMTDPIADFLARIRNAILARQAEVIAPASKLKQRLCVLLKDEGYIAGWDVRDGFTGMPEIVVRLRWADPRTNAITAP